MAKMAKMAKISKKFLGLSVFCWVLIVIVFLFVTGIVRVSFVFTENFENNSKNNDDYRKKNNLQCEIIKNGRPICERKGCEWKTVDEETGKKGCVCCKKVV